MLIDIGFSIPKLNFIALLYRLEGLKGDRTGQHSIRINDQYRVCFSWKEGYADEVEITDYH